MKTQTLITHALSMAALLVIIGCADNNDRRLAEQAERHEQRQAEQNRHNIELHREVAEATHRLVEADAKARQEMATLQSAIQAERNETARQRDQLEKDRRGIAKSRRFDSLTAAAVANAGLLLACLLPLGLAWLLLRHADEPASDQVVVETLLDDFSSTEPKLFCSPQPVDRERSPRLTNRSSNPPESITKEEET